MPLYQYRCEKGHITERLGRMVNDQPVTVNCSHVEVRPTHRMPVAPTVFPSPEDVITTETIECGAPSQRVYSVPAAIHFHGPGFYTTDVKGRTERKRRPNAGDDLHREHDHAAAAIAKDA